MREAVERATGGAELDADALERALAQARTSATRGAPRALYPDAYEPSKAAAVLARIPPDLEARMQAYCLAAAQALGLKVVPKGGAARHYLELPAKTGRSDGGGDRAAELASADWGALLTRVESLPGVGVHALPGYGDEVRFLGTFDREEAIQNQSLAFFASGQMLVEGLMLELEDGARGRAVLLEISGSGHTGLGLLCVFRDGPGVGRRWRSTATVDSSPRGATAVLEGLPSARPLRGPKQPGALGRAGARAGRGRARGRPRRARRRSLVPPDLSPRGPPSEGQDAQLARLAQREAAVEHALLDLGHVRAPPRHHHGRVARKRRVELAEQVLVAAHEHVAPHELEILRLDTA